MRTMRMLLHRLRSLIRRRKADEELEREIELHLDQLTRLNFASGMPLIEARQAARREFGPDAAIREKCRDTRRVNWLQDFFKDLGYAWRSLMRTPVFAATAILTIALGIGVNTAVFSVIHTVLLDPLPFRDPGKLVHVAETHPEFPAFQVAAPDFYDWQRMSKSFDGLAAYTFQEMNKWTILGDGEPEPVQTVQASYRLFPLLGVQPLLGRWYSGDEEARKAPVILINESLWRRKYGADPSIIGRRIRLVDWPVTVIGVVSKHQAQPPWADVWMPLSFLDPALTQTRRFHALEVIGRVKSGITMEQAHAEMKGIAASLGRSFPETNGIIGAAVIPLSSWTTGEIRPALLIAWAAVSLVLLLACANVAHLVLVRTVHRSREMAVRVALGAGTSRLTRFLLAENLAVAAAGGVAGALLAHLFLPWLTQSAGGEIPRLDSPSLTLAAFLFGTALAVLCSILFALPALFHSRRLDIQQVIKQSSGVSMGHRRSWFGSSIIAAEIALALVVLTGAGLLYRSFVVLLNEETGFDRNGVLAVEIPLALDWQQSAKVFEQQVAPRLRAIPGVVSVSAANCGPMMLKSTETSRFSTRFGIVGQVFDPGSYPVAQLRWTTPGYFDTLHIPLKAGRLLTEADIGKPAYLINEALARRYFPHQDPVGRQILNGVTGPSPQASPIAGVVGDVRDLGLDLEPRPTLYQLAVSNRMTVLIRAQVAPASLIAPVREAIRAVNPDAPITTNAPLENIIRTSLARRRFALQLLGVFAVLAALLTAVGVYGVISYSLSQRSSEFAIRMALGAGRGHLTRLILRGFAIPAAAGILAGAWLAYLFARTLRTQLYKLSPADPGVLSACALALLVLVAASALRPAARAASISPMSVPRE